MNTRASLRTIREYELERIIPLIPPGSAVLEIGAGSGWQSRILSDQGLAVEAIEIDGSRYEKDRVFPIRKYDGRNIPYPDSSFDVVFSSNVLEHVPRFDCFLREIKRVLRWNGLAIHIVPSAGWRFWSAFAHNINGWKGLQRVAFSGIYHTWILSDMTRESARMYAQETRRCLKQVMLPPPPHGEHGSFLSEFYLFSRWRWTSLFHRAGWKIRLRSANRLLYSGGTCAPLVGLKTRCILSYFLGSSCHIFLLEPDAPNA
jgi:SAM-dependent methyltransferase